MRKLWHAIEDYIHSPDPLGRVANLIALCIVGNQPIYPLYVAWALGHWNSTVLYTWLTAPFFALVPWAGWRDIKAGKLLMCLAGIGNTALSVMLLGRASGVALFFIPCALLSIILLGRWIGWLLALAALSLWPALDAISSASLPLLFRLNAFSVGTLCGFILLLTYRARKQMTQENNRLGN